MNNKFKILIVTVLYSRISKTLNLINSLRNLNNKGHSLHHFIVNNNSKENIPHEIKQNSKVFLELKDNLGFGGACNLGIKSALENEYDLIWFLNNDIIINQDLYDEFMLKIPKYDAVTSPMMYVDGTFETNGSGYVNFLTGRGYKNKYSSRFNYFNFACTIVKTKSFQKIGLFDSKNFFLYWEDADLGYRFLRKGLIVGFTNTNSIHDDHDKPINFTMYSNYSASACRFFQKNTPFKLGIVPSLVGTFLRSFKRLVNFQFNFFFITWIKFFEIFFKKS